MRRRGIVVALALLAVLALAAGSAALLLCRPGLPPRSPSRPEGRVVLPARAAPAQLRLSTSPAGARVAVDGRPLEGRTPELFEVGSGRRHLLEVELDGHRTAMMELVLEPGEVRELHLDLAPLP